MRCALWCLRLEPMIWMAFSRKFSKGNTRPYQATTPWIWDNWSRRSCRCNHIRDQTPSKFCRCPSSWKDSASISCVKMAVPSQPWRRRSRTQTCSGQSNCRKMCSNWLCRNQTTETSTTRPCLYKNRPRTAHLLNLRRYKIPTSERLLITQPTKMYLSQSSVASQRRLKWPLRKPLNLQHPNSSNRLRHWSEMRATHSYKANHQDLLLLTKSKPNLRSSEWSRNPRQSSNSKNNSRRSKVLKRYRITMRRSMN